MGNLVKKMCALEALQKDDQYVQNAEQFAEQGLKIQTSQRLEPDQYVPYEDQGPYVPYEEDPEQCARSMAFLSQIAVGHGTVGHGNYDDYEESQQQCGGRQKKEEREVSYESTSMTTQDNMTKRQVGLWMGNINALYVDKKGRPLYVWGGDEAEDGKGETRCWKTFIDNPINKPRYEEILNSINPRSNMQGKIIIEHIPWDPLQQQEPTEKIKVFLEKQFDEKIKVFLDQGFLGEANSTPDRSERPHSKLRKAIEQLKKMIDQKSQVCYSIAEREIKKLGKDVLGAFRKQFPKRHRFNCRFMEQKKIYKAKKKRRPRRGIEQKQNLKMLRA